MNWCKIVLSTSPRSTRDVCTTRRTTNFVNTACYAAFNPSVPKITLFLPSRATLRVALPYIIPLYATLPLYFLLPYYRISNLPLVSPKPTCNEAPYCKHISVFRKLCIKAPLVSGEPPYQRP